MPYILVEDFRGGLDNRRSNVTAQAGTLVTLKNAHINRGGEIEKRQAFVKLTTLPSNSTGLTASNGQIYVFGHEASSAVTFASGTPANLNYMRLQHPTPSTAITSILGTSFFNGQVYASAQYEDGRIYHFYNGTRITDWFDARARNKFQITGGSAGGTSATGSFKITGGNSFSGNDLRVVRINGVAVCNSVAHTGDNSTTASNVATAINNFSSSPNYTATSSTNTVIITASNVGISTNGFAITTEVDGAVTVGSIVNMSGGIDNAITNITVNGVSIIDKQIVWSTSHTYFASLIADAINEYITTPEYEATSVDQNVNIITKESGSSFNNYAVVITVSGNVTTAFVPTSQTYLDGGASSLPTYTPGNYIKPVKTKMYSLSDSLLHYSATNDPNEWNDTSQGAGFINLSNNASGSEDLQAIANYFDNIAVFAKQAVQIWFVDADDTRNSQVQVLGNTGTFAPNTVVEFGDNDVFYLSNSGIRSLRARDSSNAAFVGDIGNPIDDTIIKAIQADTSISEEATAILNPIDGRYMLALGNSIYVFSYYPSSKISAWSVYETGFTVNQWAFDGTNILARSGNDLYALGGTDNQTYDNSTVEVQLPFLDAGSPATSKDFTGLDVTCENEWTVSVATDPTDISTIEEIATVNKTTYGLGRVSMTGYSTHIAPKFVCTKQGNAKLGNVVVHYESSDAG
tara:strand:- start:585 stop:2651 length:2067 start_codon:yes stop_codon:yes gene_type:complete